MKSDFPWRAAAEIDQELAKHIEKIGTPIAAVSTLASTATTAQIVTGFNLLIAALIAGGKMEN